MRLSGAVLQALNDQKEECVAVLQAAAKEDQAQTEQQQQQQQQQQRRQQQQQGCRVLRQAPVVVEEVPAQQSAGEVRRGPPAPPICAGSRRGGTKARHAGVEFVFNMCRVVSWELTGGFYMERQRRPGRRSAVLHSLQATQADSSTSGSVVLGGRPSSPVGSVSSCASERGSGAAPRTYAFDTASGGGPARPLPGQRLISLTFEERVELCMRSLARVGDAPAELAAQGGAEMDSFALSMP